MMFGIYFAAGRDKSLEMKSKKNKYKKEKTLTLTLSLCGAVNSESYNTLIPAPVKERAKGKGWRSILISAL